MKIADLRRVWILSIVLFALATSALAQQKRPMTFTDVMELRCVGSGSISPDGKWVLYTVSIPQWKVGKNYTDIFIAPTDGSAPPRQMTFTKEKNESNPQWARDSKQIAFLSDRGEKQQVYLMQIDGGEARAVSEHKDGANSFAFSRDGKWLAFSAGKPEERQLWLVDLTKEDPAVQLSKHSTPVVSFQWSPDSTRVFFIATDTQDKDDQKRREKNFNARIWDDVRSPQHIWSVSVGDKSEKRWTSGSDYSIEGIGQSMDGQWLGFRTVSTDRHANRTTQDESELYLMNLTSGEIRRLTNNKVG